MDRDNLDAVTYSALGQRRFFHVYVHCLRYVLRSLETISFVCLSELSLLTDK